MKTLGELLAREIFKLGDELASPCNRIQFKGGDWFSGNESNQGGIGEKSLADIIDQRLDRYGINKYAFKP